MTRTNEVGEDQAGQRCEPADSNAVEHEERRYSHLEIDSLRQTQPMQCCKGVGDVVVTTQSIQFYFISPHGIAMPKGLYVVAVVFSFFFDA